MKKTQIEFLDKFHSNLLNSQENKLMTGEKYKNGKQTLNAHDLNHDQWVDLLVLNDYSELWRDANSYLAKK
tara:strand:- start:20 stop:232 length:213 start_codon:yes stop_codon:yes gene_type:complete